MNKLRTAFPALALAGICASAAPAAPVEVRFTAYGVAHVKADDFQGAGYGYGWAFARDNLCLALDHAITLAGERSRRLGPDQTHTDLFGALAGGAEIRNEDSDTFYEAYLPQSSLAAAKAYASPEARALVRGFTAGFNAHIDEPPLPGERCRNEPGFRHMTEDDVWRRALHIPFLETSNHLLQEIVDAAPPQSAKPRRPGAAVTPKDLADRPPSGSNAAAFGRDMTLNGRGMSFSNPHFPWSGPERLYAVHLIVPGRLNVFGAGLYGFPLPMLGFNQSFAWSITYTTDSHATVYELDLDPAVPTRYRVGDRFEDMKPVLVSTPVKTDEGVKTRVHVLWRTRYGFVLVSNQLPWTTRKAYALADPEAANVRLLDQFLDLARSPDVHRAKAALDKHMSVPWSNVTAADSAGEALYANVSLTPNITNEQLAHCRAEINKDYLPINAIAPVLKGSDPACAWRNDPAAVQPGTIPPAGRPFAFRSDFAFNSNDSYWLPTFTATGVLEGYANVIGNERTLRGERTRMGALLALGRQSGEDGLGPPGIDPGKWEALFFRSRNLMAELLLDDLLTDCRRDPKVDLGSPTGVVDLTHACDVLGRWDRTDRLEARGSTLFAQFIRNLERLPETGMKLADRYWLVPFDPKDPLRTPRGLKVTAETRAALARAVVMLAASGVSLEAPLGRVQHAERNGVFLPMSGSSYAYNMVVAPLRAKDGLAPVATGDSYMHIIGFGPDGPKGRFIVTYSQSTNPLSPHFADMTALFSSQSLANVDFTPEEIGADQIGPTVILNTPPPNAKVN